MKLGQLRAAIRAEKNVSVSVFGMQVLVQKGSLLDALGKAFPEGKGQETDMELVDGVLNEVFDDIPASEQIERAEALAAARQAPVLPRQIDLEDAIADSLLRDIDDGPVAPASSDDLDDLL